MDWGKKQLGSPTTVLLNTWLNASGIREGKVFRRLSKTGNVIGRDLSLTSLRRIIKNSIDEAGLKEGRYSGHSLRVGSVRSLAEHGVTLVELMEEGRWKSPRMAAHYASDQFALRSATARLRYGAQPIGIIKDSHKD